MIKFLRVNLQIESENCEREIRLRFVQKGSKEMMAATPFIAKLSGGIGVQLDKFDNAHHPKHDALARAQYKHWSAQQIGVLELMSVEDKSLLRL